MAEAVKKEKVDELTVYILGADSPGQESSARKKPAIITFHDVGTNHETCFGDFLQHEDLKSLLEHFIIYHIDAPGQEPGAPDLCGNYRYPSMQQLAAMVGSVIDKWNLEDVICFGVGAGADVMAHLMESEWADRIKGLVLVGPVILVDEETENSGVLDLGRESGENMRPNNVKKFRESFHMSCITSDFLERIRTHKIKASVMIASGEHSKLKKNAENLCQALASGPVDSKRCKLKVITDCGENVLEGRPKCMAGELQSFISECAGTQKNWVGYVPIAVGAGLGAVGAIAAAPFVLGAIGFGSAGIAAGSLAASMMSASAIANGGGVVAGGVVATLQSVGAAGLGAAGAAAVGGAGAATGAGLGAGVGAVLNRGGDGDDGKTDADVRGDGGKTDADVGGDGDKTGTRGWSWSKWW